MTGAGREPGSCPADDPEFPRAAAARTAWLYVVMVSSLALGPGVFVACAAIVGAWCVRRYRRTRSAAGDPGRP